MKRRTFLKSMVATSLVAPAYPAWCAATKKAATKKPPAPSDEEILAGAADRIEKHRRANGVIVIRDRNGNPVRGAEIKLEQIRHQFLFGANFFQFGLGGDLGEQYRERFKALLNYCTLGFYWASYEPAQGKPGYDSTDQVVDFCAKNGITCKGHPLVWDHSCSAPPWLPADLKEVERLSKQRVRDIVSRYKGRIDIWDVVNEPTHLFETVNVSHMNELGRAMGQTRYVADHVKVARAANPSATLLVNDYRDNPPYYKVLDAVREEKRLLFDVVGLQSHMHAGAWPVSKVWGICELFRPLGLPLHFTETTIVSGKQSAKDQWQPTDKGGEEAQAIAVEKFYTTLFSHPSMQAISWWDITDYGAWMAAPAGWLRTDMSPKPSYDKLMSLIKGRWWTKADGHSNTDGKCEFRAFLGTHRVLITLPNGTQVSREIEWRADKRNEFQIQLS